MSLELPRPAGWPLVGHLPHLASRGLGYVAEVQDAHGDIYLLRAGPVPVVLLNHPDHARRVLVDNADNYVKDGTFWSSVRSLIGLGLPTLEGDVWRDRRRLMNPTFRRDRVAQMGLAVIETLDAQLATWPIDAPFDVARAVSQATMAVIVRTMFGTGLSPDQAAEVTDALSFSLDHMLQKIVTDALPAYIPVPGRAAHRDAVRRIDEVLFALITQRRREPTDGDDVLGMLLELRDEDGSGLGDQDLRDEAMSLFIAGYETTAASVSWGLARMALDPELAAPVVTEVDAALGGRRPTPADLAALPATARLFEETLRLHGPVFFLPRVAVADDTLSGYHVPAGTMVSLMIDRIHRHPSAWTDPDRFDPDRFTPERSAGRHPAAFIPFGAGKRQCIGKGFAMLEGVMLLALVLRRFRLEPVPGTHLEPQLGITRRPRGGVPLQLRARVSRSRAARARG
jgi:cytochrome P450